MKYLAKFIIQGQFRSLITAGVIGGLSQLLLPLSLISSAIVSLYVLRKGEKEGIVVFLGTAAIIYIMSLYVQSRPGLHFPVALILLLPVYLCSRVLRGTESQGYAIATAAACSAIFAFAVQLISGDAVVWWGEWLKTALVGVKGANYEGFEVDGTILVMNGLVSMLLGMATIASVLIARWLQSALYNPGGFKEEFQMIQIPRFFYMV